jgi:hypothetical protein
MAITITNDAASTRTNLGLGDAATKTTGTGAGNVPLNSNLSTVAASGAYADVSGTPTFKTVGGTSIEGSGNIESLPTGGSPGQVVTNTSSGVGTWQDAGGAGGKYAFQAKLSSDQLIPVTTWSKINMSNEDIDVGGNYDNTNYRFTAPDAGVYYFYMGVTIASMNGINDKLYMRPYVNGNQPTNDHSEAVWSAWAAGNNMAQTNTTGLLTLSAGDYVEAYAYTTAGSRNLYTSGSNFMGFKLS